MILFVVSLITFLLMHAVPGGPFDREKALPKEIIGQSERALPSGRAVVEAVRAVSVRRADAPHLLDQARAVSLQDDFLINIHDRRSALVQLDELRALLHLPQPHGQRHLQAAAADLDAAWACMALLVALIIGMPLGILAALKQNTVWDYLGMSVAIFGVSVPVIVLGPILVWIFGVSLKWLPPTGWGAKPPYVLGFLPSQPGLGLLQVRHHAAVRAGPGPARPSSPA